ncbi:hypothetical protein [Teredinibacter purpureus]|uniref:hypothetical protein n=1 Tax=Teredinibacter purpureus TaxID=2731756 RepID=UPI0005F808D4|nr:hypothetical protein [Teredinibacter purpureus]
MLTKNFFKKTSVHAGGDGKYQITEAGYELLKNNIVGIPGAPRKVMRQEFIEKLDEASWSKSKLKSLIEHIDAEKRSIKSRLSQLSSEPKDNDPVGRERQVLIRRMKDKSSFLTEERAIVIARLGKIKINQAALNRANCSKAGYAEAFMAAAEYRLDEELLSELDQLAASILMQSE